MFFSEETRKSAGACARHHDRLGPCLYSRGMSPEDESISLETDKDGAIVFLEIVRLG